MSILVRTGTGINDVQWKDSINAGEKVFTSGKVWQKTAQGGSYTCLQRTGGGINDVDYRSLSLMSEIEKKARQLYAILSKYNGDWRYAVRRPDQGTYYGGNVTLNESEGYIGFTGGGFSSSSSVPSGYPFPQNPSNWNTLKQEILNLGDCSFLKVVNGYDSQEFSDCFLDADATYNSVSSGSKGLRFYQRSSTSSAISYPLRFYFR